MLRTVYDDDHEAFRKTIRDFIESEVVPVYDDRYAAGIVPREFYNALGELAVYGIEVAEEYGGAGIESYKFQAVPHHRPLPAAARRLRLHHRVPGGPTFRRQPRQSHIRRHQRGDEVDHRQEHGAVTAWA